MNIFGSEEVVEMEKTTGPALREGVVYQQEDISVMMVARSVMKNYARRGAVVDIIWRTTSGILWTNTWSAKGFKDAFGSREDQVFTNGFSIIVDTN